MPSARAPLLPLSELLQHEIDHLDSVLFLDRMEGFETLAYFEEYQRYWIEEEEGEEE